MERDQFYETVERRGSLADRADATDATRAVLTTLGETLDRRDAQHLEGSLPREIGDHLTGDAAGRRLSPEEFLERVEERADRTATGDPETIAGAVLSTLVEHVDGSETEAVRERLESLGYEGLFDADAAAVD